MNHRGHLAYLLAACGIAAAGTNVAHATDRYWIAPLIGNWGDSQNWSTIPGGVATGGVPQSGDDVNIHERSVCLYTFAGTPFPNFGILDISGVGPGVTTVQHGDEPLATVSLVVGEGTPNNDYIMFDGSHVTGNAFVGTGVGGGGSFDLSADAEFVCIDMFVGNNGGTGDLTIGGTLFEFDDLFISAGLLPGSGSCDIDGGMVLGDRVFVGRTAEGSLWQTGGDIDVNSYSIGWTDTSPRSTSIHTGGTLDVSGTLEVAVDVDGAGQFTVDGGVISAGSLVVGKGQSTDGAVILSTGSITSGQTLVGDGGDPSMTQIGGAYATGSLSIGRNNGLGTPAHFNAFGGTADVTTFISVGSLLNGSGRLLIDGGQVTCNSMLLGDGLNSEGELVVESGSLDVIAVLSVADEGPGDYVQNGGSVTANVIGVGTNSAQEGRLDVFGGSLTVFDRFFNRTFTTIHAGDVSINELQNQFGGVFRIDHDADLQAPIVVNDGTFEFSIDASGFLSGPALPPPFSARLLGDFQNNGTLDVSTSLAAGFGMNLTNNGTVDILAGAGLNVNGSFQNEGVANVDSVAVRGVPSSLDVAGSGLLNEGRLILRNGVVRSSNAPVVNNGDIEGTGQIEGGVQNNSRILFGLQPGNIGELVIDGGLAFSPNGALLVNIQPGIQSSVRVVSGGCSLDGVLSVDFDNFAQPPAPGTQYEILRVQGFGILSGTFASVLNASVPFRVEYLADRVLVVVETCPGDITTTGGGAPGTPDGVTDLSDLLYYVNLWDADLGPTPGSDADLTTTGTSAGSPGFGEPDGVVDLADLLFYVNEWTLGLGACP